METIEPHYEPDYSLSRINSLEAQIIANGKGSDSLLFTEMITMTSYWIDKESYNKKIHISPFKQELDKQVELVAYKIECGMRTDDAIGSIGTNASDFRKKLTDTHRLILGAARKKRLHYKHY